MQELSEMEEYHQGVNAFRYGKSQGTCPYEGKSQELKRKAWMAGWSDESCN